MGHRLEVMVGNSWEVSRAPWKQNQLWSFLKEEIRSWRSGSLTWTLLAWVSEQPSVFHNRASKMGWMSVSSQHSKVEIVTPNVIMLQGGAFGS